MNPRIKKQWVDALRSGEYNQGDGALRSFDDYCCLGVLCDLHAKAHKCDWIKQTDENGETDVYIGEREVLPQVVAKWAGFTDAELTLSHTGAANVRINEPFEEGDSVTYEKSTLADMNDNGNSFAVIAECIEEQL